MDVRKRFYSGGPWETKVGYCRATRVGDQVIVSGTTAMKDGELVGPDDPAAQAEQTLQTIAAALAEAGTSIEDVVRYRVYLTRIEDYPTIAPVLASWFGDVHPCNTLLVVAGLIHPQMRIEIEADAIIGSAAPVKSSR